MNNDLKIYSIQKTALTRSLTSLSDGFNASVGDKLSNVSPPELSTIYHKTAGLSNNENASVDRTGFELAPSGGEPDSLPLTYRPKYTEAHLAYHLNRHLARKGLIK